jgi:hypothetical protein
MEQLLMVVSFVKPLCFGVLVAGKRGHKGAKTLSFHKEFLIEFLLRNEFIKFKQL